MSAKPQHDVNQQLEWEVNRLLKQLKYPPSHAARPRASRPGVRTGVDAVEGSGPSPAGVWARLALGGTLALAITQWPYGRACGASLGLYLLVIGMVALVGGWSAVGSWRRRMGLAHVLAVCLGLWGIALAAVEVLPRVGYARAQAAWMCGSGR